MRLRLTVLGLALAVLAGCVTADKRSKKTAAQLKKKPPAHGKPITNEELADDQPVAQPAPKKSLKNKLAGKPGATTAAVQAPIVTAQQSQECQAAVQKFAPAYGALYKNLQPGTYAPSGGSMDQLVAARPEMCSDPARRAGLVAAINDAVTGQGGRIGVILPLTGQNAKLATYIVNGLRAAFQEAGANFDKVTVLKDSAGNAKNADTRLAELVFNDRVAMVIGGFERSEAESLAKWSNDLNVPALLLNRDRDLVTASPFAFMLYPDEKRLAETLAEAAVKRGLKRVAILRPASGKSNKVSEYFKAALQAKGGVASYDIAYTAGNFESMEGASRQLFKADAADRAGEYRAAYMKARKQAEKEGVPFDPRMVVLKPIVDFDALFLPDDFRTVRHFAKLFKYHMVDHLPLIGNHEWRSPALIDPYDEFLDGSLFADFIGSYARLPAAIGAPTLNSPLFIQPASVVTVDFQLIGYRAGRVARAATSKPGMSRSDVPPAMMALTGDGNTYFKGPVFDQGRHSNWPTYVFTVSKKNLTLDSESAAMVQAGTDRAVAGR